MSSRFSPQTPADVSALPASRTIETLYSNHCRWLQGWLRHRLRSDFDAADVVQDVFARLLAKTAVPAFESPPQERAYLSKIATGLCINLWHRRELEQAWLETLAARPQDTAPSPEQALVVLETLREVSHAIGSLRGKGPQAFIHAVIQGMTEAQVAQELGLSTRMVRKHVAQGMLACMLLKARYASEQITPF